MPSANCLSLLPVVRALCFRVFALALIFVPILVVSPVRAEDQLFLTPLEDSEEAPPIGEENPRWHLAADKLTTLSNNTVVEAEGGVVLTRGNDVLKADFARYYSETDWIYLKGNVFVRMGRDDIKAETAEFDLRSKTGWLTNGDVFMEGQHIYFKGERIIKHYGDRYTFQRAKLTTCDGDTPAWSVTADQAVVEIDGYAQLFSSSFQVRDTGVMYTPFMILPANTSRQSGFLAPDYGVSNKRGLYYTQPYFWAIDESSDMTFYGGFMTERGGLMGAEYRSHTFTGQKTWMAFTGIYDRKTITNSNQNDVYPGSSLLRSNNERFWLRGMADGFFGTSGWKYRSNIDYVSDQNYLREFNNGPTGFNSSRNQMFSMFGRDLREYDQNRVSSGMVYRDWNRFGVVGSLRYQQNPALAHGNAPLSRDTLVQELPRLDAFLYKGYVVPTLPLEVEAQFTSGYMYRRSGTSGLRSEISPTLSLPLDLGFVSIISSVGVRQTWYSNTSSSNNALFDMSSGGNPRQTSEGRTIPRVDFQIFSEANRVWDFDDESLSISDPVGSTDLVALRHQVQPRVRYSYTSHVDQERNPYYSEDDRLLPTNELTYSITNILTRKNARVVPGEEINGAPGPASIGFEYANLVRWRLESGYDFNEASRKKYRDEYKIRPIMDVVSDLEFNITDWMGYGGKLYLSAYSGKTTRQDHGVWFSWPAKAQWSVGVSQRSSDYDYRRRLRYENRNNVHPAEPVRLLYNSLLWNISNEWSVALADYRNMREGGNLGRAYDQSFRVTYTAQCYRFVGEFRYDNYEKSFSIMVELPGLFE